MKTHTPGVLAEGPSEPLAGRRSPQTAFALRAGVALLPGRGFVDDVTVVVDGGLVVEVRDGRARKTSAIPEVEAPGGTLLPGLVDSHVHLSFNGRSNVVEDLASASDVTLGLRALHNAQVALSRGITTLADCGDRGGVALRLRDAIAEGRLVGPRILSGGTPITTTAGHCAWLGGCADSLDEVIREARRQVAAGVDFLKVMLTGGNITPGSNPLMLQYPAEVLTALGLEALRLGRPLVVHAHSEEAVALAASAGAAVVAHATCASPAGIALDRSTVAALLASGSAVDPTITVGMPRASEDAQATSDRSRVRQEMLPLFSHLHAVGVPLLAGTDAGVTHVPHGTTGRAVLALQHDVGLDLDEALVAATEVAARVLGLGAVTGSIAPGLAADLLLVDDDVRSHPGSVLRPSRVWSRGVLAAAGGSLVLQ